MPPMPPNATRVAEHMTRFRWPRMLLAWYVRTVGTFATGNRRDTKIPHTIVVMEAQQRKLHNRDRRVEDQNQPTEMELVTRPPHLCP
jgi:hypothetical protein